MKKHLITILICLSFWSNMNAQELALDSLQLLLVEVRGEPEELKVLNELSAVSLELAKYKEALRYAQHAQEVSSKMTSDTLTIAKIYFLIGESHRFLRDMKQAQKAYQIALDLYQHRDERQFIQTSISMAKIAIQLSNYTYAKALLDNAHNKASIASDTLLYIQLLHSQTQVFEVMGQIDSAYHKLKEAITLDSLQTIQDSNASLYTRMVSLSIHLGNTKMALLYILTAEKLLTKQKQKGELASLYYYKGNLYERHGSLDKALEFYLLALELIGNSVPHNKIAFILAISNIYQKTSEYDMAMEYYTKGFAIADTIGSAYYKAYCTLLMGHVAMWQGNYALAITQLEKALASFKKLGNQHHAIMAINYIGEVYNAKGDCQKAIQYFEEAYEQAVQLKDYHMLTKVVTNMGRCFVTLGDLVQAKTYIYQAKSMAEKHQFTGYLIDIYFQLYRLASARDSSESALVSHQRYITLRDSLYGAEQQEKINFLKIEKGLNDAQLLLDQKNAELDRLKGKSSVGMKTKYWLTGIGISLVFLLFAYWYWRNKTLISEGAEHHQRAVDDLIASIEQHKTDRAMMDKELETRELRLQDQATQIAHAQAVLRKTYDHIKEIQNKKLCVLPFELKQLGKLLRKENDLEKALELFLETVNYVHPNFYNRLQERFPNLNENELRLCVFIRLDMNINDVAQVMMLSASSVKSTRFRIRKKLNLSTDESLHLFMGSI